MKGAGFRYMTFFEGGGSDHGRDNPYRIQSLYLNNPI